MKRRVVMALGIVSLTAACGGGGSSPQDREALEAADKEWSQSTKDIDKFVSFYAPDASIYPPGMGVVTGVENIKKTFGPMVASPGFALTWTSSKTDVSGDIGYAVGNYQMTLGGTNDKGKTITVWRRINGQWKVTDDIFNSDLPPVPSAPHVMVPADKLTWGPAPPSLPPGAKMAVVSGDPSKAELFTIRAQFPAGYTVKPHWHPTDEHVTVISGTLALGMGDSVDAAGAQNLTAGGYAALPAMMHHYAIARTPTTIQVHGMGPFIVNYVNPADAPGAGAK